MIVGLLLPGTAAAAFDPATPLQPDPAVRRGTLANGLRWEVYRTRLPAGAVSLRLGVAVGSYDETETERGAAHFIEHMAFRSTRRFPKSSVDEVFAPQGVEFGRDHNAQTGLFNTRFELDLPTANGPTLDKAFTWLRDVADGVTFEPADVDIERQVVLAEKEARHDSGQIWDEAFRRFLAGGRRSADRAPIGAGDSARRLTPRDLLGFYERWYRPDTVTIVAVGDMDLAQLESRIKAAFETWRAPSPAPAHASREARTPPRGLTALTLGDPTDAPAAAVCMTPTPVRPPLVTQGDRRQRILSALWREALFQRLQDARGDAGAGLIDAAVQSDDSDGDYRSECIQFTPSADWRTAFGRIGQELRRFERDGPSLEEVDAALDSLRAEGRGAVVDRPNRTAPEAADDLLDHALETLPVLEPKRALHDLDQIAETISVRDVRQSFARDWSGDGPFLALVSPEAPGSDQLLAAWNQTAANDALSPYSPRHLDGWAYSDLPKGAVSERTPGPRGGYVRLRFANGVTLLFRRSTTQARSVSYAINIGRGRRELSAIDMARMQIAAPLINLGGLGRHPKEDLSRLTGGDADKFSMSVGERALQVSDDTDVANMPDRLRVLAAFLRDPGFRPSMDASLAQAADVALRRVMSQPDALAASALYDAVTPGNGWGVDAIRRLGRMDHAAAAQLLRRRLTTEPVEIAIVGDLKESDARDLVASTLGALPRRAPPAPDVEANYIRFPESGAPPVRVRHTGPTDKAAVKMIWPLYVASVKRRREESAITVLAAVFQLELRKRVRGDLGKSYDPAVTTDMRDDSDQGELAVQMETYPADLAGVTQEAAAVARRLAAGGVSTEALEAARRPMLAQARQDLGSNAAWASALANLSDADPALSDLLDYPAMLAAITLDEVKAAARNWLSREPLAAFATPADAP